MISGKLYGREAEIDALVAAFDRVVSHGTEFVLVSVYSGIGKSSVVDEIHKVVVPHARGYHTARRTGGRCDRRRITDTGRQFTSPPMTAL